MAVEIERKFLVTGNSWRSKAVGKIYCQGYIPTHGLTTVRVRIVDENGFITIKSAMEGLTRLEFEYPIPVNDAKEMLETLCSRPLIEKTRYILRLNGLTWEIDEFEGENKGLIIAEVELERADQEIYHPEWLGQEVSDDPRYLNSNLAKNPFICWHEKA